MRNGMPQSNDVSEPRGGAADQDPVSIGRMAFLSGDVEKAKRLADEVISIDTLRQDAWILKGRALVCRLDPTGAKECYQQALDIDDRNHEAWRRKGFAHRVNGELTDAIACWKRSLEVGPEDNRTLNDIANAMDDLGRFDSAIEYYERVLEVDPDNAFARENIRLNKRIITKLMQQRAGSD